MCRAFWVVLYWSFRSQAWALHIGLGLGRLDEDEDYADREFQCDPRSEKKIKYAEQASVTVANHILEAAGVTQWLIFISYRGGAGLVSPAFLCHLYSVHFASTLPGVVSLQS